MFIYNKYLSSKYKNKIFVDTEKNKKLKIDDHKI